jgi:hypothetical protein
VEKSLSSGSNYYSDPKMAEKSLHYELIRNLTIGRIFAGDKTFRLINLGFEKLFHDENRDKLELFVNSLFCKQQFQMVTWECVLSKLIENSVEQWLTQEIYERLRRTSGSTRLGYRLTG